MSIDTADNKLTRIGVFYDGNFWWRVSNYYLYYHARRARISIGGLHDFIRKTVAAKEGVDERYCQIIDAHYFRGRLSARDAEARNLLRGERLFDEVLVREGVTTHYLPLAGDKETGIDVWFALEAFELAIYKRFNVCVLIACDGDYVPLARKLNTIGARVMVLGWDFKYVDAEGTERETRTSQWLLDEVTYPVLMSREIDDRTRRNDPLLNNLFLARRETAGTTIARTPRTTEEAGPFEGTVHSLKEGFGFIVPSSSGYRGPQSLFFYYGELLDVDFNDLKPGDRVTFHLGENAKGPCAVKISAAPAPSPSLDND
jgi:cold shock CspA family protein